MKVSVTVVEADDMVKLDPLLKFDAQCSVALNHRDVTHKTKLIENTTTPKWDENIIFYLVSLEVKLVVQLFDRQSPWASCDIPLGNRPIGEPVDEWFQMTPVDKEDQPPKIRLIIEITRLSSEEIDIVLSKDGPGFSNPNVSNSDLNISIGSSQEQDFMKENEQCSGKLETEGKSTDENSQQMTEENIENVQNIEEQNSEIDSNEIDISAEEDKEGSCKVPEKGGKSETDESDQDAEDPLPDPIPEEEDLSEQNKIKTEEADEEEEIPIEENVNKVPPTTPENMSSKRQNSFASPKSLPTKEDKMRAKLLNMSSMELIDDILDYNQISEDAEARARAIYMAFYRRTALGLISNHRIVNNEAKSQRTLEDSSVNKLVDAALAGEEEDMEYEEDNFSAEEDEI